jgi:hypothetical protein
MTSSKMDKGGGEKQGEGFGPIETGEDVSAQLPVFSLSVCVSVSVSACV